MNFITTKFDDVFIIEPIVYKDSRGYFTESFRYDILENYAKTNINFVLEFESRSVKNTLRGLHYQFEPYAQSKLVSVSYGKVLDIIVDIRKSSKTFMQHIIVELSDENNRQVFIPKGYAHGFLVMSDIAVMHYKLDGYYNESSYKGINIFDKDLNIDLPIDSELLVISNKDKDLPLLKNTIIFD